MNDFLESLVPEQFFHAVPIGQVQPDHSKIGIVIKKGSARVLQLDIVIIIEVIEADDGIAAFE